MFKKAKHVYYPFLTLFTYLIKGEKVWFSFQV